MGGVGDDDASRKRKKKGGRDGPKKPLSSYMIFVREERRAIAQRNPDAKFNDIGKLLGERWAKLTDAEKKKYVDMATQDKQRYTDELEQYHHAPSMMPIGQGMPDIPLVQHDQQV
jgi:hypothetical protein